MKQRAISSMVSMIPSVVTGVTEGDFEKIKTIVRETFPGVQQVDPSTLEDWLRTPDSLLLIDVRDPEEFSVSHLPGAVNLQTEAQIRKLIREKRPARTVLYCSVGFRSAKIAARLSKLQGIYNLEGSIFEWANQGRPLFNQNEKAEHVHPFGNRWAGLLKPGRALKV